MAQAGGRWRWLRRVLSVFLRPGRSAPREELPTHPSALPPPRLGFARGGTVDAARRLLYRSSRA